MPCREPSSPRVRVGQKGMCAAQTGVAARCGMRPRMHASLCQSYGNGRGPRLEGRRLALARQSSAPGGSLPGVRPLRRPPLGGTPPVTPRAAGRAARLQAREAPRARTARAGCARARRSRLLGAEHGLGGGEARDGDAQGAAGHIVEADLLGRGWGVGQRMRGDGGRRVAAGGCMMRVGNAC